jgi:tripartite-type tricarboxylate transporter receptor subunit TctC
LPGYEVEAWFGFAAPAGTPEPGIALLNAGMVKGSPDAAQEVLTTKRGK